MEAWSKAVGYAWLVAAMALVIGIAIDGAPK